MKQRIFTFGCSFTNWIWPTWANILLYKNDGVNFGFKGAGVEHILHTIVECDRKYKFNENDIVVVMFTTPIRWDLILGEKELIWKCNGQTTTSDHKKYLDELFSVEGLIYKSLNNILIINNYLKNKNTNYYLTSMNDMFNDFGNYFENITVNDNLKELIEYVKNEVKLDIPNIHTYLYGNEKKWNTTKIWADLYDYHPSSLNHYNWMIDTFPNELKSLIKVDKQLIINIEKDIIDFNGKWSDGEKFLKNKYKDLFINQVQNFCFVNDYEKYGNNIINL
jgi:hypothetical protein